ncbi:MAG: hypothetical protein LBJ87_02230, partial [bacterium]|nr:hypothetical protein [bacterium]
MFFASLLSVLVLAVVATASTPALAAEPTPTPGSGGTVSGMQSSAQSASFSVDTVPVTVSSRFLPASQFVVSKNGDLTQTATASAPRPYANL